MSELVLALMHSDVMETSGVKAGIWLSKHCGSCCVYKGKPAAMLNKGTGYLQQIFHSTQCFILKPIKAYDQEKLLIWKIRQSLALSQHEHIAYRDSLCVC